MFTNTHKAIAFAVAKLVLCLCVACSGIPEFYGPLCDDAETGNWSVSYSPELDRAEYYAWVDDPEVESLLRRYGMDDDWDFLSGNDINDDGIVVSPYGKTLNAYELIVTTPGLEGWANTLAQSYPVHGSCGSRRPNEVATTWDTRKEKRIDLYEHFYNLNVVARAGFLIHETAHATGAGGHRDDCDPSWDDHGAYRLQVEFLAAVYHAPGLPEVFREAALNEFEWMVEEKFIEAIDITIEDLGPEG
ncbi:MAG: hypothetical protein JRE81_03995 [Deltaproteobacteria bacterium]|jgi:hypothetical protein|nr:hypothetical protein [Deltaproteobacteria bacterium]